MSKILLEFFRDFAPNYEALDMRDGGATEAVYERKQMWNVAALGTTEAVNRAEEENRGQELTI